MLNKINISLGRQKLIVYIFLAVITLAVFWQVNQFDFINFDDNVYVTQNSHIQSGITLEGFLWAFSTNYYHLWHPLIWLSFMFDYQLHGLNAGGYHLTNLILHILSTLLLFWLFNRMTGTIWRSAFVAAFFALHPLHVESVAWISERKDVLSAFFWMLTLCLYVYYTEKPVIKRYLLVLFCFICALMSKPMVITLPVIMILLDYWPLGRFKSKKDNLFLWQLKEKMPFFILSAVLVIIIFYTPDNPVITKLPLSSQLANAPVMTPLPLGSRLANAPVSFVTYLEKTFWPHDLAFFYPFPDQLSLWQVFGTTLLIIVISAAVIVMVKRLPYLFVGWLWYAITILPVIKIVQVGYDAMADRYHYLPSIGIAVMLAWGIPLLIKNENTRKKILFPAATAFIIVLSVLTWQQCGYWKNSITLFSHAVQVTKGIYLTHNNRGVTYSNLGQYQLAIEDLDAAIRLKPDFAYAYYNRGGAYAGLGQHALAIKDYSKAIRLKPDFADAFYNRAIVYDKLGQYALAIKDYNEAIRLKPDFANAYYKRGFVYNKLGQHAIAIKDYNEAIRLKPDFANAYYNRGSVYDDLRQEQRAIKDYSEAIRLKPDYADAYNNRGIDYLNQGNNKLGCSDAQKTCALGNCKLLEMAKGKGACL